jgi:hypothetical protein
VQCSVLYCIVIQFSVVQCSVSYCSAVQCSAVQVLYCSVVQYSVVQCSVLYCSVVQYSVVQCSVLYCSVVQCSALCCRQCIVLHCTVQYSVVQYSAVQCAVLCILWSDEYFILHLCLSYLELFYLLYLCFFFFFLLSNLLHLPPITSFPHSPPSLSSFPLLIPSHHSLTLLPSPPSLSSFPPSSHVVQYTRSLAFQRLLKFTISPSHADCALSVISRYIRKGHTGEEALKRAIRSLENSTLKITEKGPSKVPIFELSLRGLKVHHYRLTYDHRSTVHIQDFLLSDHARYPVIHIKFQKRENESNKNRKGKGKGGGRDRKTWNFDPILGPGSALTNQVVRRPLNSKLNAADIEVLARESAEREAERSGCALVVSYVQQVRTLFTILFVTLDFSSCPSLSHSSTSLLPRLSSLLSPLLSPTPSFPISTALTSSGKEGSGSLRCTNRPYCVSSIILTEKES